MALSALQQPLIIPAACCIESKSEWHEWKFQRLEILSEVQCGTRVMPPEPGCVLPRQEN